jgi:hypothetical protein
MELPLTDSDVLEGLLDRFSENPTADQRRAIVSLFQATVNDARAFIRSQAESLGLVCAGQAGPFANFNPPDDRSREVGTKVYAGWWTDERHGSWLRRTTQS